MPTVDCGQLADPANGVVLLNDTVFLSTATYLVRVTLYKEMPLEHVWLVETGLVASHHVSLCL